MGIAYARHTVSIKDGYDMIQCRRALRLLRKHLKFCNICAIYWYLTENSLMFDAPKALVGIDIGTHSIKVVRLKQRAKATSCSILHLPSTGSHCRREHCRA